MARVQKEPPRPKPVQVQLHGKLYTGTYTVAPDGTVTVSCAYGSKSRHNKSIPPYGLAEFLLIDLIELIPKDPKDA